MKHNAMRDLCKRWAQGLTLALAATSASLSAQAVSQPPDADGTVHLGEVAVPLSDLMSDEATSYLRHIIVDQPFAPRAEDANITMIRARADDLLNKLIVPMRQRYAVEAREERIGGVLVDVITPVEGVRPENHDRVLINVHGGGFVVQARTGAMVESAPLASIMGIKVISIDYRMFPEHSFPAASQDVAKVYRELLKRYKPSQMAIYGCSAGGILTGQAIAWFQKESLPNPSSIGVFCAALGPLFVGDSNYTAGPLLGGKPTPIVKNSPTNPLGYLRNASATDPLAYPLVSRTVLEKFPPTLFITGTRSLEFSSAVHSNNQLSLAGVESRLHAWDGLHHAFFYNSELPESREAYQIMADFFASHFEK